VNVSATIDKTSSDVIAALGFTDEMRILRQRIAAWVESCDLEMREALEWQFLAGSKYFRPMTIFACYRSLIPGPIPERIISSAVVIEFFHNVSLVVDDIVDRSPERRGRATLHTRFGELNALMVSGYIVADGYRYLGADLQAIGLFSELLKRLGVAECMQWRLRRQMLGVEDWRRIAGEDTGSMFEVCACLGDRSPVPRLRRCRGCPRGDRPRRRRRGGRA
jgi:geranylgeranyl pyrophosphate synthase